MNPRPHDVPRSSPGDPRRTNVDKAAGYYVNALGFTLDWGDDEGGIAGISRGNWRGRRRKYRNVVVSSVAAANLSNRRWSRSPRGWALSSSTKRANTQ
jgi:hypothetical protein